MLNNRIFQVQELYDQGFTKAHIHTAVENGMLLRVGHGWYASPHAPPDQILAASEGVRLTCISAGKFHDLWTPLHQRLHVFGVHGRPQQGAQQFIIHRSPRLDAWPDNNPVAPLDLMLLHAGKCLPIVDAAILFESALNQEKILLADALAIIDELPKRRSIPLSRISPEAQSGTETKVRWFLESRGVQVEAQVEIDGVGRVDIVVGKSLVIECDSVQYHAGTEQYYKDRERDQELIRQGYLPIHLTWEDVCLRWESTVALLEAILASRRHRFMRPNLG